MAKWNLFQVCKASLTFNNQLMEFTSTRLKKKKIRIISIDAEKACDKIQHTFMTKTLSKLGVKENFLNLVKSICRKTYS